jgi:hypothetical protein
MSYLSFPSPQSSPHDEALRTEVRTFLARELAERTPLERARSWDGIDVDFSRRLGQQGWIGMTWPKRYGGHERSAFERYVVVEELLAAGAPVGAHWIADRQSGPLILRFGTEEQKMRVVPRIAAGECFVCIGMSEPDVGSDLASVRTTAVPDGDGFRVNGTKLWTTAAHIAHYMILFCRTGESTERHGNVSQFLVDLKTPGITIRPIHDISGDHHFNEVTFQDVQLPSNALIGRAGDGWNQVTSELAFERSGPERFLSCHILLTELIRVLRRDPSESAAVAIGRLTAHLMVLRRLSRGICTLLERGENPALQAAIVKDLGAIYEQEIPEVARQLVATEPTRTSTKAFCAVLSYTMMNVPAFSLRGGTREILRGIVARGLGLR